jgi:ornithine carbamoyltransferase
MTTADLACTLMGVNFSNASPPGYVVTPNMLDLARGFATDTGAEVFCTEKSAEAAQGADVIYTDVWTSMGQEAETEMRRQVFAGYQVNEELMSLAKEDVIFMHPLPAHHGEEVSEGVVEGYSSVVFDQAENRMHIQKALLAGCWEIGCVSQEA